ncbi:hypothetical protein SAMN05660895_0546 [Thermoflavifilum thermophilum]|uniref:Uncharacterized protein n=1 Tax=Thermoflavifilum thermophilum TaxID=1393122 RepID=A0A1I7N413_9BACT|nr:hypothetical protein SAMN05660895_0546 [Thermoflavifilum thermophilum]
MIYSIYQQDKTKLLSALFRFKHLQYHRISKVCQNQGNNSVYTLHNDQSYHKLRNFDPHYPGIYFMV